MSKQHRYVNWISDELDKGCEIFKLTYKNDSIGFLHLRILEMARVIHFYQECIKTI